MILRQAKAEDLHIIMNWIRDEKSCRIWAGPGLRFPFVWDRLITDLGFFTYDTYVLADNKDNPVGLGQIIDRDGHQHLARILVNPDCRGLGYGRVLCNKLIERGRSQNKNKPFSLNVNRHNKVAIKLYESLGFIISPNQKTIPTPDSIFMIRSA